ncbi:MAG: helix-turn-helix domain-containing protein [Acidobacteriota bacterium]|nr:helix-turn-helix domain-containing protein [Acidobacteriota bacterium]
MIKNERQYRITKAQAGKFEDALAQQAANTETSNHLHPLVQKAQKDALASQFTDLKAELREYDALRSGERKILELTSFDEFPRALIQARIASGLSQKALADKLGIKEQQLQRYEATEYASASVERIKEVIKVLGLTIRKDVFLPDAPMTAASMFKRLKEVGLNKDFVLNRLVPRSVAARLQNITRKEDEKIPVLQAAAAISRILKCSVASLFGEAPLQFGEAAAVGRMRFKVKAGSNEKKTNAYAVYAMYLAGLTLDATVDLPQRTIPTDSAVVRQEVLTKFGAINFECVLKYYWNLGVPVLPLRDSGAFHGACVREDGRNVIVLKQQTASLAKWLDDLLHEGYHAGQSPEEKYREIIEHGETSEERRKSPEEQQAGKFSGDVILDGRGDELIVKCIKAADSDIKRLKSVVPQVAKRENVPVDALANHLAYKMWLVGKNWWGAANNLQDTSRQPWQIARDLFLKNVNFGSLNEIDGRLLEQAMSDIEE